MEYDDLDEPEEQVESQTYLSHAQHFETQVRRAQNSHAHAFYITNSLSETRIQQVRQQGYFSLDNVGDGIKREDVPEGETGSRWPHKYQHESVSLLHDMPVRMPIKVENNISLRTEYNLGNQPEPYSEQRYRVGLRDDLDEPVTLPPPQRTRLDLVDDLDEPEDLSQASETDFHDDLHEPADLRPPVALAVHDAHDDLDDLDEPVANPPPEVSRGDHVLVDDLEDPVAPTHQSHREGMKYREELRDDLGDPDVDEETFRTPSSSDGRMDHLYDDLDEVLVDELISEVSDLVLQSYESAYGREEPMEEVYAPDPRTPIARRFIHHSSESRHDIGHPSGTRAHVTSSTQQGPHMELQDGKINEHNVGGTPNSETQHVTRRIRDKSQQIMTQLTSQEVGQGNKTPRSAIRSSVSQHHRSSSSVTSGALEPLVPSQPMVNETGDELSSMRTSVGQSSSQIHTVLAVPNNAEDVKTSIDDAGSVRERMHQHASASSEDTEFSSDVSPKHDATQRSDPQQSPISLTRPPPNEQSAPSPSQSQEARILSRSLLPPSHVPFRDGPLSDALSSAAEDMNPPHHPMEISSPGTAVATLPLESSKSDAPAINEDTPQLNPTKKVRNLPSTLVASAWAVQPPTTRTRQRSAGGGGSRRAPVQTETVLTRIDALLAAVDTCRQRGETPELLLPAKTKWRDLQFCTSAGHLVLSDETPRPEVRVRGECRLNMMVLLLQKIRHLVSTNTHSTKRDIYYQEASLFGSQRTVDALLDDVTSLLAIPRESSHVRATSKGLVAGDLVLRCGDVIMDCSAAKHGLLVPENVPHVQLVRSTARFILVVEKDATFQKILDSGVLSQLPPGIVITGKGFPDLNTRLLLKMLTTRLSVPALALVDADPHGLEIFFVYKYGSLARARESDRLAAPGLIWLGVRPTEVLQLDIPRSALLPLTAADRSKAQCLLSRPYVKHNRLWQRQIREILASGRKAEIQCLSAIHPTFLTDLYLPSKIQECLAEHERQAVRTAEHARQTVREEGVATLSGPPQQQQQQQQQCVEPAVTEGGEGVSRGRREGTEGGSQQRTEARAEGGREEWEQGAVQTRLAK